MTDRLLHPRFPRANLYHPDWVLGGVSGGANPLWLAEWLSAEVDLRPGMRVLDLGCGRAMSSVFLHREFGVEVWACDLWFSPADNLERVRDAGFAGGIFPLRADARILPFAAEFFDAVISIDSFFYYGTDDLYLNYLARFVKPGGVIAMAGAGLMREIEGAVPAHLASWWTQDLWLLHTAEWWRRHWAKTGIVDVVAADAMEDGWRLWLDWLAHVAPENQAEIDTIRADQGEYLGYVRAIGRRRQVELTETDIRIPPGYSRHPLLR